MSKSVPSLRLCAFNNQKGRCYYCGLPMWAQNPSAFATQYALTIRLAAHLRCTAEHLIPRENGGKNSYRNIVAACHYCNGHRHRRKKVLSAKLHKQRVQKRMARKRWHTQAIHASNLHSLNDDRGANDLPKTTPSSLIRSVQSSTDSQTEMRRLL